MNSIRSRVKRWGVALYNWWNSSSRFFRASVVVLLTLLLMVTGFLFQESDEVPGARNNLLVFFLVYLNIIILLLLAFLIGRNVVKLIFDRKRGMLGSRLQTKLVVAFAGIAIATNIVLFIFAGGLVSTALESWFGEQVEDAASGALEVSKNHYNFLKDQVARESERLGYRLKRAASGGLSTAELNQKLESERIEAGLYGAVLIDKDQKILAEAHNAAAVVDTFSEPPFDKKGIARALGGKVSVLSEEKDSSQFIRGYYPLKIADSECALVTTMRVSADLTAALDLVNDSVKQYRQSKLYKRSLKAGYLLTLLLITVVILFSAVWFGMYISKQITTPIIELSDATRRVARGDYETTLSSIGDDEMGALARSFNRMLADLKTSRDDGEKRRLFIETILSRLAIGVIALNKAREVTSTNQAAIGILGLRGVTEIVGKPLRTVIGNELFEVLEPILTSVEGDDLKGLREADLTVSVEGSERKIICTGGRLTERGGAWLGSVLLFDDVTELAKAQSMTVWREVAQRIAHEIKNPLTPIQLSAQRLLRLVTDKEKDGAVLDCAETIVQNVDLIKRLANEFSNFARMPNTEFRSAKLNEVLLEVTSLYTTSREDVDVKLLPDLSLPEVLVDTEQLKRVIINLIDNSLDAMSQSPSKDGRPQILVKTKYNPAEKEVSIEVADNGPGIAGADKIRIFEPYFTTKKGGTGIGLAIVLSIITDHQGTIRVFDNTPRGARFVITLPIDQKHSTQRRLAV